jgi:tRNA U38,U39,U40 pseudouridine synthase TruA
MILWSIIVFLVLTPNWLEQVNSISLVDEGGGYYRVDVHVESALYRMIRNIVGSSFDVACGQMSLQTLKRLLEDASASRQDNKAQSAPPEGLALEMVFYDNY